MEESRIIDYIKNKFSMPNGIGDDAAIFAKNHVISKDLLIEDIHFRKRYFDAKNLAHKSLHVNLSDMAAMGANPLFIMLGIAIPKNSANYMQNFVEEFCDICQKNNVKIIGGDTTSAIDKISISITIIGINDKPIKRNTANIGDVVCIIGDIGYAHVGFKALETKVEGLNLFKDAFLEPRAKLKEASLLAGEDGINAMMDVSDGLAIDLKKLCLSSNVSAEINIEELEFTKEFLAACEILELDPLSVVLMGGEDYGLLVTMNPNIYSNFKTFPLKKIGLIKKGNAGDIIYSKDIKLSLPAFSHFREL